jgi:threonine/homoserine/homoserine lactone efflux protein
MRKILTAMQARLGLPSLAPLMIATRQRAGALRRPAVVRSMDRMTGGLLVALGLRLAMEPRP